MTPKPQRERSRCGKGSLLETWAGKVVVVGARDEEETWRGERFYCQEEAENLKSIRKSEEYLTEHGEGNVSCW